MADSLVALSKKVPDAEALKKAQTVLREQAHAEVVGAIETILLAKVESMIERLGNETDQGAINRCKGELNLLRGFLGELNNARASAPRAGRK